jgi:predicted deacylase
MQSEVVAEGVKAINTLLAKTGMYGKQQRWTRIAPVYYRSAWVRANQSGILFSKATLGQRVKEEDILGTVTDPITNARTTIKSPYNGRIIGMALDQVVLPGFAAYHIGIQTPEAILIEESQMNEGVLEEDEEDGDDSGVDSSDEIDEPETGVSKAQDRMADE